MRPLLSVLLLAAALFVTAAPVAVHRRAAFQSAGVWADDNYSHYRSITFPASEVAESASAVVPIDLSNLPAHFWDNTRTDLADVRFYSSDHSTLMPHTLEAVDDTAETGIAYIYVYLDATTDQAAHLYYDYPSAAAFSTPEDVFDATGADYMGLWLMDDAADGPQDSATALAAIQLDNFNTESGDQVAGQLGHSVDLDGSNEYYKTTTSTDATNNLRPDTTFTAGCWFYAGDFSDGVPFQGSGSSTSAGYGFWIWGSNFRASLGNGGNVWTGLTEATAGESADTWYQYIFTWDGSNARAYLDGTELGSSPVAETGSWTWSSQPFFVGRRESAGYYHGRIDHIFVHDDTWNANRIALQYALEALTYGLTISTPQTDKP